MKERKELTKEEKLAIKILEYARNNILVKFRFFDLALSKFRYGVYDDTIGTNRNRIFFNPNYLFELFKKDSNLVTRTYLHLMMHSIFQHMIGFEQYETELWDLSCDITVENLVLELSQDIEKISGDNEKIKLIKRLKEDINKTLTAERIYNFLQSNTRMRNELFEKRDLFKMDDHSAWNLGLLEEKNPTKLIIGDNGNSDSDSESLDEFTKDWKEISEAMENALKNFSKGMGKTSGDLMISLNNINRKKCDYKDFLRKFAVLNETMKMSPDEYDYLFYTYGLNLYENMPLIEPLEYKEEYQVKEFVIAIDTSGSVLGDQVKAFLEKTYSILKNSESFAKKVNIHIIQCDADIVDDVKVTNDSELEEYFNHLTLKGFGGTDFRPVFNYVDEMVENKEFTNLKGIIYFTDGYGVFPEYVPKYDTAFVFINQYDNNISVPPWAIKIILEEDEFKEKN